MYELFIKPSPYISGFCYSIFRLEPYIGCSLACKYCYARWYRGLTKLEPARGAVQSFASIAKK